MSRADAFSDRCERMAIAWACGTIAKKWPHLRLEATRGGWRVWWRADETDPEEILHDVHGPDLDWRGLVAFAKSAGD